MDTENVAPRPAVGLIADHAFPDAAAALSRVAAELERFGLAAEASPTPTLEAVRAYAREAAGEGRRALVVASADPTLAREVAAQTTLPVVRVPVGGTPGNSLPLLWPDPADDVTGPAHGGHATVAIGEAGARNAALFVVSMLALTDKALGDRWRNFRRVQTQAVLDSKLPPEWVR